MPNGIKICFIWAPSFLCDKFIINQTTMEITSTEKVENKIARNGYLCEFEKMLATNVQCFECRRKGNQCKAMIKLDTDDDITGEVNLHTHAPSHTQVEVENIKRKVQTTTDTPQQILGAELRNTSHNAVANIPSTSTMRRNISKVREYNDVPHTPVTREDRPVLPEQYQNTAPGESFIIYDSGAGDQEQMFRFASKIGLQLLRESEHWYADGIFKVCLEIFYQLYAIHGQRK